MIGKNNPFNIRYNNLNNLNKWIGQIGQTKGFCDFDTLEHGVRAAAYLILRSYKKKGICTYSKIIYRFAPSVENNSAAYLEYVCDRLNTFPFDIPKGKAAYGLLLSAMARYEGNPVNYHVIDYVLNEYFKDEDFR